MYNQLRALMEIPVWYLFTPEGLANLRDNPIFRPASRFSALYACLECQPGTMLSISLNVFLLIIMCITWRKLSPKPKNVEWQGIWNGLGKI